MSRVTVTVDHSTWPVETKDRLIGEPVISTFVNCCILRVRFWGKVFQTARFCSISIYPLNKGIGWMFNWSHFIFDKWSIVQVHTLFKTTILLVLSLYKKGISWLAVSTGFLSYMYFSYSVVFVFYTGSYLYFTFTTQGGEGRCWR